MTVRIGELLDRYRTDVPPQPVPAGETNEDRAARLAAQAANRRAPFDRAMPAEFRNATLDQLPSAQRRQVTGWLTGTSRTLVLTGPVGTGKTHAAYAVMLAAADTGRWVAAWTVPDLLIQLAPDGDTSALYRSRNCDLLLLDDLGAEKPSEWRAEQMATLLDARVREGRRQIATTNLSYTQLADRYGDRTMSRLTGGATVVQMTGPDRRRTEW